MKRSMMAGLGLALAVAVGAAGSDANGSPIQSTKEKVEDSAKKVAKDAAKGTKKVAKETSEAAVEGAKVVAGAAKGTAEGVKEGIVGAPNTLTAEERAEGVELLFNGNDLSGFRGYKQKTVPAGWKVEDGAVARVGDGGDLVTDRQFADFELQFEWKIAPRGNSGVMYRVSEDLDKPYYTGPEYQILDNGAHADAKNGPDRTAAANYALNAPTKDKTKPVGEWNQARIVVKGAHVEHWLNGEKVVEYELWSPDWTARVKASKFNQWPQYGQAKSGHIVFQDHGDPVWYRNVKIKELK